jgi:hypothetical protein
MESQRAKLQISKIPKLNTIVIQQEGTDFFIPTKNGIIISVRQLANLLLIMMRLGYLNPKVLEGVLEDIHTNERYKEEPNDG